MNNDIIKRQAVEPEVRGAEKPQKAETPETKPQLNQDVKAPETSDSSASKPNNDKDKLGYKDKNPEIQQTQGAPEVKKQPAGPAFAIVSAIFVCLVLVGMLVYGQMSKN